MAGQQLPYHVVWRQTLHNAGDGLYDHRIAISGWYPEGYHRGPRIICGIADWLSRLVPTPDVSEVIEIAKGSRH